MNHSAERSNPAGTRNQDFFGKSRHCFVWESSTTIFWLFKLLPEFHTTFSRKTKPFSQFMKTTENKDKIIITPKVMNEVQEIDEVSDNCLQLAVRQPLPGKQWDLMTDASFDRRDSQFWRRVITIKNLRQHAKLLPQKHTIPKRSRLTNKNVLFMPKKLNLAIKLTIKQVGHFFWGAPEPFNIMTWKAGLKNTRVKLN